METLYLITSNPGKLASFQAVVQNLSLPFSVDMLAATYPEDKTEETCESVAHHGAEYCAEKFQQPVLVTDVGIFIDALNGFPGVNTSFTLKRVGTAGILRLLGNSNNRAVEWRLALGFCRPGKIPHVFSTQLQGTIALEERGSDGFGFDSIFVPAGEIKTLAEDIVLRDRVSPLRAAILDFTSWYKAQ